MSEHCKHCGTLLDDDLEAVDGRYHSEDRCREYIKVSFSRSYNDVRDEMVRLSKGFVMKTYINIGNYVTVAEILKQCKENGWDPEDAYLDVEVFTEYSSWGGDPYPTKEIYLKCDGMR